MPILYIARDFTRYPGTRYRRNGAFSGEEFREDKLIPELRKSIEANEVLTVVIDDVAGYGSSFLEEAFGGLVRAGFDPKQLERHLRVEAKTQRFKHHQVRVNEYIKAAQALLAKTD